MTKAFEQPRANIIQLVKLVQEVDGTPGSFPTTVSPCVYKAMPVSVSYSPAEGSGVTIKVATDPDRALYVANIRQNNPKLGSYYFVYQLKKDTYVLDNQAAFLENM